MTFSKLIGLSFGILTLFAVGTSEARSSVNFGFGINVQPPSYAYEPYYVEEYYYPAERVIVHQDPYGRTISEHVYVAPRRTRAVHVRKAYRPAPVRPFFSLGFFG